MAASLPRLPHPGGRVANSGFCLTQGAGANAFLKTVSLGMEKPSTSSGDVLTQALGSRQPLAVRISRFVVGNPLVYGDRSSIASRSIRCMSSQRNGQGDFISWKTFAQ